MDQNMHKKMHMYIDFLYFENTPVKLGFLGDAAMFSLVLCGGMLNAPSICASPPTPHIQRQALLSFSHNAL
jgi:hypothetical protein